MGFGARFQKWREVYSFNGQLLSMGRCQQIAQQRLEPGDLLENALQRSAGARRVIAGKRVLGFQPHRGERIADFVREARRQPTNSGETLGGARRLTGDLKSLAGGIEGCNQPVEIDITCWLKARHRALPSTETLLQA